MITTATFLSSLKSSGTVSSATIDALSQDLAILERYVKNRNWAKLTQADIRSFIASEHMRGLAPTSLRRILSSWRKFFAYLSDAFAIESNPAEGVRAPRSRTGLPKALSPDDMSKLLAAEAKDDISLRDLAMFEVMYSSALRVSELTNLDYSDIDLHAQMVNVRLGKGSKQRLVPIGKQAINSIKKYLPIRAKWKNSADDALFINKHGKRLTVRSTQYRLKVLVQKAGLPGNVTPHSLRHSCASHLLQSSGDLRGVQEFLGHADVASTQVYTHLDFQALAKVYDTAHPRARKKQ